MSQPMRYEIENAEIQELMVKLGHGLKDSMPPGYGFTLLIFGFSPNDELFYLSSAQREDMVRTMREFVKKFGEN